MEKRELCLNFIKGVCDLKGHCNLGHYIVSDKEEFLKSYEANKSKYTLTTAEYRQQTFTDMVSKDGSKVKVITACISCGVGFFFDDRIIKRGDYESKYCEKCRKQKVR